jgi:hypothetical protein
MSVLKLPSLFDVQQKERELIEGYSLLGCSAV